MTRFLAAVAMCGIVLGSFGAMVAVANPLQNGTVIELSAANDTGKTFDHYLRTYGVQALGGVVGIGGLCMVSSRPGQGALGALSGIGICFYPGIVGSGAQQAQAATALLSSGPTPALFSLPFLIHVGALAWGTVALRTHLRRRTA